MSEKNETLFDITGRLLELYEICDDPDVDPQVWQDTFEAVEGEFETKADAYAALIAKLKNDGKGIKQMETRLYERRKAIENSIDRITKGLEQAMIATGKTKFKTMYWSYGIQKNPPTVVIDADIKDIPEQYLKYAEPTIDKAAIKDDLKDGEDLHGIAHLEQTEGLRIR